ncbi:hypothetical protein B0T18DRAFT_439543 [Schizothecium vesticola]|uniref:Glycoside hydrolase family 125 protein n=1 Tax=Schizothecium vesticola TaxID=314040 RepID=A0AA40EQR4_9PEZI|nr:hypothetical protein B0T18DRAFT_439543 [Schizothecium vesticola]
MKGPYLVLLSLVPRLGAHGSVLGDPTGPCPDYSSYAYEKHEPLSKGRFQLAYQRPAPRCRKFPLAEVDETIATMKRTIRDPDLFRLFENCFPNTLDTAITWKGLAAKASETDEDEELTYITTGDINAMWLRDSANQLSSYRTLLRPNASTSSLASLFRGTINLQSRYLLSAPHCNAFHPPPESSLLTPFALALSPAATDIFSPLPPPSAGVYECKFELDSLAAFLQLSHEYHSTTHDTSFFSSSRTWLRAVTTLLDTASALTGGTYLPDGRVAPPGYIFQRSTTSASETLSNSGMGAPVKGGTGMVRSAFRPSDDACVFPLFVPGNMMLARYLGACAGIVEAMAGEVRAGVERYGRVQHRGFGKVYAYEVDGFGGVNVMDDANIPSLLAAPMFRYMDRNDPIYQNTRRFILSRDNPYYMVGPVLNGTGGPHVGPGMAWPMSLIVRILTTDDDTEIVDSLRQLLSSTAGLGLMHEAVNTHRATSWTRQWFSWANGLFGQMILDLKQRKPHLLERSYQ